MLPFKSLPQKPTPALTPIQLPPIVSKSDLHLLQSGADQALLREISSHKNSRYPWGSMLPPSSINNNLVYDSFFVPNRPTTTLSSICTQIKRRTNNRVVFICKRTTKIINGSPTTGVLVYRIR